MEDYKEKYEQALERAKSFTDYTNVLASIFPELKESEDERIKKEIIQFLQLPHPQFVGKRNHEEWIAWLEKQGKEKHTCRNCQTFQDLHQNCSYSPIHQYTDLKEAHKHLNDETNCEYWLEKQGEPIDEEEILIGARKRIALSIMDFLDRNTLGMCLSSMECKHLEDAVVGSDWRAVYNYMKKKLEKQDEQPNKVSIWKHWNNGSIGGNGDGKLIYLVKIGNTYMLSSCLGFECDYIELSELDKLYVEKQGEQETDEWKEGNIIRHGGILALVIKGRRAMKSNGELFTVQYPNEWVKAAPNEIEHFLNEFEKQGEQKLFNDDKYQTVPVKILDRLYESEKELERLKQYEQNPTDKAEPNFNFKVGQWIVAAGKCVYLITKIDGFNVTLVDANGDESVFDAGSLDDAHLWTIQDAKDGDVLVTRYKQPFIFKSYDKDTDCVYAYCGICDLVKDDGFYIDKYDELWTIDAYPATKEQRDALMKAMTDAGYTFDFENKELKKKS